MAERTEVNSEILRRVENITRVKPEYVNDKMKELIEFVGRHKCCLIHVICVLHEKTGNLLAMLTYLLDSTEDYEDLKYIIEACQFGNAQDTLE